ncbi:hypothetical protein D3C78_1986770 [compost metagenome]
MAHSALDSRSMPVASFTWVAKTVISARSMSSPPSSVLPLVESTSKTPSVMRRIEMSKVPPPRS